MSTQDKNLFTPGPLNCSLSVKQAMLRDLGSRDIEFINTVRSIRKDLLQIAGVSSEKFTSILLQGSGTYCVEAVLQNVTPRSAATVLLLINGAYGRRMRAICEYSDIATHSLEFAEDVIVTASVVKEQLKASRYCAVCIVHCETSSGIVNPVSEIGSLVRELQPQACYVVDAMSSFGAIPLDLEVAGVDFVISSANKCLQGVPGFAFVVARTNKLMQCKGNARSLSFDLVSQYEGLEKDGQFRFTPPTHALLAFYQALKEFHLEGGVSARAARYKQNCKIIQESMTELGFKKLLTGENDGYIITSFFMPNHPKFHFDQFYKKLSDKGQVIYPGKVTQAACFRIGHIGALGPEHMKHLIQCIREVLADMKVQI